jgi:hypothetical protein
LWSAVIEGGAVSLRGGYWWARPFTRMAPVLCARDATEGPETAIGVGPGLCRVGTSENVPSEAVRKGSEERAVKPYGPPKRYFSAHFGLGIRPKSTPRALLIPLFGQSLYELR